MRHFCPESFRKKLASLTQAEGSIATVCRNADINRQQFNKYLVGENIPSIGIAFRIAKALNVSLDELVSLTLDETPKAETLDDIFRNTCTFSDQRVAHGDYIEVVTYDVEPDVFLLSLVTMKPAENGGIYTRTDYGTTFDGALVVQNFSGRYYEASRKITVFYSNTSSPNTLGALCLRNIDAYSNDLVGTKSAHRFANGVEPMVAPVGLIYLGNARENDTLKSLQRTMHKDELPHKVAIMAEYMFQNLKFENHRLRM